MLLQRGAITQTVAFPLREEALPIALAGAEAAVERLAKEDWGWVPAPERARLSPPFEPRDNGIAEPGDPPSRPFESWDAGLGSGEDVAFDYTYDGYGWYAVEVRVGDVVGGFGGGYLTDPMGDLLRVALALIADAGRAELTCNAEPALTRVEFERVTLGHDVTPAGRPLPREGCRIVIRDVDGSGRAGEVEFEALGRSPRAVAEAIYRMALSNFADGAGPWSAPMAALEAALGAVPREE
jgi:hypothetical protein